MRFLISYTYQCTDDENSEKFLGEFELESEVKLQKEDLLVFNSARRDAIKFHQSGMGSISIDSIQYLI